MKLKTSMFAMLFLFTIIPLFSFGAVMIHENNKNVETIVSNNLESISNSQIYDIQNFCNSLKKNMEIISQYSIIHDSILKSLNHEKLSEHDYAYITNILIERRKYHDAVKSISIIDKNFKIISSSEFYDSNIISDFSNATKPEYIGGSFFISNIQKYELNNETNKSLVAYKGIYDKNELIGYIIKEIDPDYFDHNRQNVSLSKYGTFYLLDGDDKIITAGHSDEQSLTEYVTSTDERSDYNKAWEAVDLEQTPSGKISYTMNNQDYITYYSTIDFTDWYILVTMNLSAYQNTTKTYRNLIITSIVFLSAFLLVINYFISKRFTKPVNSISEILNRVQREQDYSLRIKNPRKDEIGTLSNEINSMLDYVEQEYILEKQHRNFLTRKAELDPLTGINNKQAFEEKTRKLLSHSLRNGQKVALGFLDIDDFKYYNTNYGHKEGDNVIVFVADILKHNINGLVGRNGGDEFVFAIENITDYKLLEDNMNNILKQLNTGVFNNQTNQLMPIPCSMGVVVADNNNLHYSTMIQYADETMYKAKNSSKNTCEFCYL